MIPSSLKTTSESLFRQTAEEVFTFFVSHSYEKTGISRTYRFISVLRCEMEHWVHQMLHHKPFWDPVITCGNITVCYELCALHFSFPVTKLFLHFYSCPPFIFKQKTRCWVRKLCYTLQIGLHGLCCLLTVCLYRAVPHGQSGTNLSAAMNKSSVSVCYVCVWHFKLNIQMVRQLKNTHW